MEIPRDRNGSFEPLLIAKHERRFTGFDDKIIAMYARGMTMREIQGFLLESYGVEVSAEFISSVTEAVMAEVTAWQARPLEPMYPVVFFDALRVKIKEDALVRNKAIYLALGVQRDGSRDILGLWIEGTEGAKFWMKVFNDLKTRGVDDILLAVTDGLKGMPEALAAVFPATTLQTCIVHQMRNSLDFASWKDRKALAAALRPIYTAANAEAAQAELNAFGQGPWGQKVPHCHRSLEARLEPRDSLLGVRALDPPGDLHHQRDRERSRAASQDHQDPRALPQRRGGHQADLAGVEEHHGRLGSCGQGVEGSHESVRDPQRRSLHEDSRVRCGADLPTASCVRRKRRPPPWTSLQRPHTKIPTSPYCHIFAQRAMVAQILPVQRQPVDTLAQHVAHTVLDQQRAARIGFAARCCLHQADLSINLVQPHHHAIASHAAAIKAALHHAPAQAAKFDGPAFNFFGIVWFRHAPLAGLS